MAKNICSIDGCSKAVHGRGWCLTHYRRWQRHGNPHAMLIARHGGDVEQRFWAKVDKTSGCWNWMAAVNAAGYGKYVAEGRHVLAHRYSVELATGSLLGDRLIDHRCHNPRCVRPDHLRVATPSQNNQNYRPGAARSRSGVRGVDHLPTGMWRARVQHNGQIVYSQHFSRREDAAAAVVEMRNRFHTFNDADRAQPA